MSTLFSTRTTILDAPRDVFIAYRMALISLQQSSSYVISISIAVILLVFNFPTDIYAVLILLIYVSRIE